MRLWHELHEQRNIPHDFVAMLSPSKQGHVYQAALMHDDVRAVALCHADADGKVLLQSIAHAPFQPDAAIALVNDFGGTDAVDWLEIKKQPRWFLELLFRRPAWQN